MFKTKEKERKGERERIRGRRESMVRCLWHKQENLNSILEPKAEQGGLTVMV